MDPTLPRRRRARTLLAAAALVVALIGPVTRAFAHQARIAGRTRVYVVRPGDTLWSIASKYVPGGDPRRLVDSIAERNGIDAGMIVAGQPLVMPPAA